MIIAEAWRTSSDGVSTLKVCGDRMAIVGLGNDVVITRSLLDVLAAGERGWLFAAVTAE
ncbi:hypothetical protein M6D93_13750 [Jatrophihabitans telluris]|uniref:Uncharacterized protein n=1 Tax=Jatrophihabitans telluris TaxID=2038343 RepID=A0ABY4QVL6_9ACTN|nr:hypothetical protein [Jatrophihabitans telluris]UQX87358.1 hypothetical protein M6D93_13750 [Jatrophihabitans telluris]